MPSVKYSVDSKDYVNSYNSKPKKEKKGNFWDNESDSLLATVKREIKNHYLFAQDYKCAYCRQRIVVEHNGAWDTDHIIHKDDYPQFLFEPENLCVSCKDCNRIKSNKSVLKNKNRVTYPENADHYIFCHPHFDEYGKHIRIIREAVLYLPITAKGRALIEICGLLRFVLAFAEYECSAEGVGQEIVRLGTDLQNAETDSERFMLMTIMRTMLDESLRKAALKSMGVA